MKWRGYYVNLCTCCITPWMNDQGWPKMLTPTEVADMLDNGATFRHRTCYWCEEEKRVPPHTVHSEK